MDRITSTIKSAKALYRNHACPTGGSRVGSADVERTKILFVIALQVNGRRLEDIPVCSFRSADVGGDQSIGAGAEAGTVLCCNPCIRWPRGICCP